MALAITKDGSRNASNFFGNNLICHPYNKDNLNDLLCLFSQRQDIRQKNSKVFGKQYSDITFFNLLLIFDKRF